MCHPALTLLSPRLATLRTLTPTSSSTSSAAAAAPLAARRTAARSETQPSCFTKTHSLRPANNTGTSDSDSLPLNNAPPRPASAPRAPTLVWEMQKAPIYRTFRIKNVLNIKILSKCFKITLLDPSCSLDLVTKL